MSVASLLVNGAYGYFVTGRKTPPRPRPGLARGVFWIIFVACPRVGEKMPIYSGYILDRGTLAAFCGPSLRGYRIFLRLHFEAINI